MGSFTKMCVKIEQIYSEIGFYCTKYQNLRQWKEKYGHPPCDVDWIVVQYKQLQ